MTGHPDTRPPLDRERLGDAAGPEWTVRLYDEADSTNRLACADPAPDVVVVADHQTSGRGRLDRTWVTPAGAALTFSAVVEPAVEAQWWPVIPLAAGLAVARAVGDRASLKWPNDVLAGEEKVCGILVERITPGGRAESRPLAVIGIGLNVDQTRAELPVPTATSLALAGLSRDRTELFGAVLGELRSVLARLARDPQAVLAGYRERCGTLDRRVRVHLPGEALLEGTATAIDAHGGLVVTTDAGRTATVGAGDVVHVRPA